VNILNTDAVLREEAKAIHGDKAGIPADAAEKKLYCALNKLDSAALCLSGGGIRSAAFALGVIQALAFHPRSAGGQRTAKAEDSLLGKFHYLSTVSGGGYIGSWLSAWTAREGFDEVWKHLVDIRPKPEDEPREIAWLRRYSNYLTPKLGVTSADSWAAVAISIRNLLLNWLVYLPVLIAALLVLKLFSVGVAWVGQYPPDACSPWVVGLPVGLGIVCLIVSLRFSTRHRPTRGHEQVDQTRFLWADLLPAVLSGLFFTLALALPCTYVYARELPLLSWSGNSLLADGAVAGVAIYGASWLLAWPRHRDVKDQLADFIAWLAAGLVYGAVGAMAVYVHRVTYGAGVWVLGTSEIFLLVFGVPWFLAAQLLAEMIFVGLTSAEEQSDSDREWLGRAAGWFIVTALGWLIGMFLALVGTAAVMDLYERIPRIWSTLTAVSGAVSGLATALLGKSSHSPAQGAAKTSTGFLINLGLAIAAPIFACVLILGASALLDLMLFGGPLLETESVRGPVSSDSLPSWPDAATPLFIAFGIAVLVEAISSRFVNINRFSLHALYRNRIVRAFLGASRPSRKPDPFTAFDEADNMPMHTLWPGRRADGWQPFHVVNMALNIVSTDNLAWQERKAESFTVSPLHSGSACKAYRRSCEYGHLNRGISLGTAVAISGAAASPNMGYHSSPAVTLLLALLNVRLGWWLGNPGTEGERTYRNEGPEFAIKPLLEETFGLTTDKKPYVYLSDGGHFENLGLYEMVRRRCRLIVVSDAGCDPDFTFEDLGNAVRKIRLDLGVSITFSGLTALKKRSRDPNTVRQNAPYWAVGEIDYRTADGGSPNVEVQNGIILYVKAGYHGSEGVDIKSYGLANPEFPHQSTANQWFSESQFESYRALGFRITDEVLHRALERLGYPAQASIEQILENVSGSITKPPAQPPTGRIRRRPPIPAAAPAATTPGQASEGT